MFSFFYTGTKGWQRSHWANDWPRIKLVTSENFCGPKAYLCACTGPLWSRHLKAPLTHPGGRARHTEEALDVSVSVSLSVPARVCGVAWPHLWTMCSYTHVLGGGPPPVTATSYSILFYFYLPYFQTPFLCIWFGVWAAAFCSSAKRFNKISHILHPLILPPIFQLRCSSPLQARACPPANIAERVWIVPAPLRQTSHSATKTTLYFSVLYTTGVCMSLAVRHFNYISHSRCAAKSFNLTAIIHLSFSLVFDLTCDFYSRIIKKGFSHP